MRLRQLQTFIAACELGSISRAAEKLFIAQPALGHQIRAIEDDFGVQLLARHSRGVEPTPAGKLVLEWARELLKSKAQLEARLNMLSNGVSGQLTLGLSLSLANAFAVPILEEVQAAFPEVRLSLAESVGRVLKEWLQSGHVDIALYFDDPGAPPSPDCQVSERLYFATASSGTPDDADAPISMLEVLEYPLALPSANDSLRQHAAHAARSLGAPLNIKYEVQSTSVVLALIKSGLASSILPMSLALEGVAAGWMSVRPIESPIILRDVNWHRSPVSGHASQTLLDAVQRIVVSTIRRHSSAGPLKDAYTFPGD